MVIKYSKQAYKYLSKLDELNATRIKNSINKLPYSKINVKKIKGIENLYRLRVGDYRILFSHEYDIIKIEKIAPRGDIYNGIK